VGNAGEDILISGYTSFDANDTALKAILAEWTSARSYSQRLWNLSQGTAASGLDSSKKNNRLNGNWYLIGNDGSSQTVFNDNDVDTMTGNQDKDRFLGNSLADKPSNAGAIDQVIGKQTGETYTDTDF
jgi:hypothetical protein